MPDVSAIYLRDGAAGQPVRAELWNGIGAQHLDNWTQAWRPALLDGLRKLRDRGVPLEQWPQNAHWDWRRKVQYVDGLLGARTFCVVADGMTQGLMAVDLTRSARLEDQRGKPLVYVDYLEAAPWNRRDLTGRVRLRGVGSALLTAAVALSREEGFKGRIGLHSLPQADNFYRTICGMSDLQPDPAYQNLRYFEMTPAQAQAFLEEESES